MLNPSLFHLPLVVALVLGLASCGGGDKGKVGKSGKARALQVHFTCDVAGRLEPCGCFTGQYGGLTRIRTLLRELETPDALLFDVGDAIKGTDDFHRIQHRYLATAFEILGYSALNVGHREAQLTRDQLAEIASASSVPMLGANTVDAQTRQPVVQPWTVVESKSGLKIGVIGLLDPKGLGDRVGDGLLIEDMRTTLSNVLPEVEKKSDFIIVLAFANVPAMTKLAEDFYEIDLILGGDVHQPSQDLEEINQSAILAVTNQARALGSFGCTVQPDGTRTDSTWDVQTVRDYIPEDQKLVKLSRDYRTELRTTVLDIDDPHAIRGDEVPGVKSRAASYVGSQACTSCHPKAAAVWEKSGHAHAFATLKKKDSEMDPNCVACHTIGFGQPSGYQRKFEGTKLADVGCESCHGPGQQHVAERTSGDEPLFQFRPLGAGDCKSCHHGEFSRPFEWEDFWPLIEHGKESEM